MAGVFISSTGLDLAAYRAAAIGICNRLGLIPLAMEFFEAMGAGACAGSIAKLDKADVYVGIFAHRYGYIEVGRATSVTEVEFDRAGERDLERLCFIVRPDYPWPPAAVDHEHHGALTRFKERVAHSVIRQEFTSVDDFTAKLIQSLTEWQKRQADPAALEAILDLLATRRAFFQGDERALEDAVKMLDFGDAGRAVVVARSLAGAVAEIEHALAQLRASTHPLLKDALSRLIVACKDYVEAHGDQPGESSLPLPHIGYGQRIEDFTRVDGRFGFSSTDSFEVFKTVLEYLSRSFNDLLIVRTRALEVAERIAQTEPSLAERTESVRSLLSGGSDYLKKASAALDRSARLVAEVIASTTDFQTRRASAAALAKEEKDETVARLVGAVSKLRLPKAWSQKSPATTLVAVEVVSAEYNLRVSFADGLTTSIELDPEFWQQYHGISMAPERFRRARLDAAANKVEWDPGSITGESLRALASAERGA